MPVIDEFRLDGKVALIAGDSGGYLPFLAEALAEAGARVLIGATTRDAANDAQAAARRWDQAAVGLQVEFTRQSAVDDGIRQLAGPDLKVHILVNSFRVEYARPIGDMALEEWDGVFRRQVTPAFLLCQAVGRLMVGSGGGRIINIISNLAERGMVNSTAFCASQGALLQLTRALALELGPGGVRVNALGLGQFSDKEESVEEAQRELMVRYIPLRRRGHPRDIGPLLVYLASDACDYTTGQPIYVDGGLLAHP